jgi:hypothetical protein
MGTLTRESLAVIAGFRNQSGVTEDQFRNLYTAVTGSPVLVDQFNRAVAAGMVLAVTPLSNANAGAEYDPAGRAIRVPLTKLSTDQQGKFQQAEITFAMGHEVQHGLNQGDVIAAQAAFRQAIIAKAQSPGPVHDYTDITAQRLTASRSDEASSHLAGWNALASMVRHGNPSAGLQEIYEAQRGRTGSFVDARYSSVPPTFVVRPGLALNPDLSLSSTPANIEGVAQHWYDKVPNQLGKSGSADYPNYYGRGLVSSIVQMERHFNPPAHGVSLPVIGLDTPRLRLSERQLEEAGLDFGRHTGDMTYLDLSRQPRTSHLFQHTAGSLQHVSPLAADTFEAPPADAPRRTASVDDPLREQIREGVQALDRQVGREWDDVSERMTLSLLTLAKQNGLRSVDHVVLGGQGTRAGAGQYVFLVEGALADPGHHRVQMATQEAATTPQHVSLDRLHAIEQAPLQQGQEVLQDQVRQQQASTLQR